MWFKNLPQTQNSAGLRKTYIKTVWLVMAGYVITQIETAVAISLGLTSMRYMEIILPASVAIIGTAVFIVIISIKKAPTVRFGNIMFLLQYPIFISMYTLWIYRLDEIRLLGLFCALIAVVFVMFFTTPAQSLFLSIGTMVSQICVSYYTINNLGQSGNFHRELFYTLCVFPAFVFLSFVARHLQQKTLDLINAQDNLTEINEELEKKNRELKTWQLIAKNEMELAAAIQRTLLPGEPPHASGWDIAVAYHPRHSVSGDFYDFYYSQDELKGIALFDVSGHGVSSGLLMMMAKPLLFRLFNKNLKEPLHRIMDAANRELSNEIEGTHSFITGIIVRFSNSSVEYVNAGHPNIIIKDQGSRTVKVLDEIGSGFKGNPLGLGGLTNPFKTMKFNVHRGDVLLLYTDCLVENSNSLNSPYGVQRLIDSLEDAPDGTAQEILDHIIALFKTYIQNEAMTDDFTVILAKRVR